MCVMYVLSDIVQALKTAHGAGLDDALRAAVAYLACHAQRAHPQRDRQTGRFQLGLEPLFGSNDATEIREAASVLTDENFLHVHLAEQLLTVQMHFL